MPEQTLSPRREWGLLLVLAAIQFTLVMDFVIMMPLGPQFMRAFSIGPSEFGWMISAYALSASVSGFLAAFFIDRFDRKRALLTVYAGFAIGTLLCAVAPDHHFFVFARIVAGAFGGIMNPVTFAIIGDLIPASRRGAANGTVMSSFAVASIAGVPIGLLIANAWGWHATFVFLVVISLIAGAVGAWLLPTVRGHLSPDVPARNRSLREIIGLLEPFNHRWALVMIAVLMFAGFTMIPFTATALVANAGMAEARLPWVYLCGGCATLFTSRRFGKLADRKGPLPVFWMISIGSMLPILWVAYIQPAPIALLLVLMVLFSVFVSGRFVVGTTLIHNGIEPRMRGGFLSLMTAFQNAASGAASLIAGLMISKAADGQMIGLPRVGWFAVGCTALSMWVATRIRPAIAAVPKDVRP